MPRSNCLMHDDSYSLCNDIMRLLQRPNELLNHRAQAHTKGRTVGYLKVCMIQRWWDQFRVIAKGVSDFAPSFSQVPKYSCLCCI